MIISRHLKRRANICHRDPVGAYLQFEKTLLRVNVEVSSVECRGNDNHD